MHRPLKVSPQTGDIEAILAVHSPISLAIQLGYLAPKHLSGACEAPSRTRGFARPTRRMPLGRYQDILRACPAGRCYGLAARRLHPSALMETDGDPRATAAQAE